MEYRDLNSSLATEALTNYILLSSHLRSVIELYTYMRPQKLLLDGEVCSVIFALTHVKSFLYNFVIVLHNPSNGINCWWILTSPMAQWLAGCQFEWLGFDSPTLKIAAYNDQYSMQSLNNHNPEYIHFIRLTLALIAINQTNYSSNENRICNPGSHT